MYVPIHVCIYICIYIYIYTHTHIYYTIIHTIHARINTYIHTHRIKAASDVYEENLADARKRNAKYLADLEETWKREMEATLDHNKKVHAHVCMLV